MTNLLYYDLETIKGFFLASYYDAELDLFYDFSINQYQNDLPALLKFLEENQEKSFVGYNNLNFDAQIIEFILRNKDKFLTMTNKQVSFDIWQFAQDLIETLRNGGFVPYKEYNLTHKQLDPYLILAGPNKARIGGMSLKHLEFYLDMDIETFDVSHEKETFTRSEVDNLIYYCHHDIKATQKVFNAVIGQTDFLLYKDNDQLELRKFIKLEHGLECLNFSETKLGTELLRTGYAKRKGINLSDVPKKGTFRKEIALKNILPKTLKFTNVKLKRLQEKIQNQVLKIKDKFEYEITYQNVKIKGGEGGIHSENKYEIHETNDEYILYTIDASSFYPALFINNKNYPKHLGKELFEDYQENYFERIRLKPLAKKDKKIKGKVDSIKLMLNAAIGQMNMKDSWLYDKQVFLGITIPGQLILLNLVDDLAQIDSKLVSMNTDGIEIYIKRNKLEEFEEIIKQNEERFNLVFEKEIYQKIFYLSVNDYLAIKEDGTPKLKGDFAKEVEFHKNKSNRIIPYALEKYFMENIPVEDTINNCKDLSMFYARANVNSNFYLEFIEKGKKPIRYNKIVRYFVSKKGGSLIKCKSEHCTTNAAERSEVVAGQKLTIINKIQQLTELDKEKILNTVDKNFYIQECEKIIFSIQYGMKITKINKLPSLFD